MSRRTNTTERLPMNDMAVCAYISSKERTEEPSRADRKRNNPPTWPKTARNTLFYRVYDDVHTPRDDVQTFSPFFPCQQESGNQERNEQRDAVSAALTRLGGEGKFSIQCVYGTALVINNYLSGYAVGYRKVPMAIALILVQNARLPRVDSGYSEMKQVLSIGLARHFALVALFLTRLVSNCRRKTHEAAIFSGMSQNMDTICLADRTLSQDSRPSCYDTPGLGTRRTFFGPLCLHFFPLLLIRIDKTELIAGPFPEIAKLKNGGDKAARNWGKVPVLAFNNQKLVVEELPTDEEISDDNAAALPFVMNGTVSRTTVGEIQSIHQGKNEDLLSHGKKTNVRVESCHRTAGLMPGSCKVLFNSPFASTDERRSKEGPPSFLLGILAAILALVSCMSDAVIAKEKEDKNKLLNQRTQRKGVAHCLRNRKYRKVSCPTITSLMGILICWYISACLPANEAADLREDIINEKEPCLHYTPDKNLFAMNCSVLQWQVGGYGSDTYISLGANEIFDGHNGVDNEESIIDLSGIVAFRGLIYIQNSVASLAEAPLIKNVHVRNGTVVGDGGFIVQKEQQFFVINSCSSTGDITGYNSGGICGSDCADLNISNSYSTGRIMGSGAGGITGRAVTGRVNITQCYSSGSIEERDAGGICGSFTAHAYITRSYSTGDILESAYGSGGIVGSNAALFIGLVHIEECYSKGRISADYSGGITGANAASSEGKVHIIDCYTRGDIDGQYAGGITGASTGGGSEGYGDVYITNTYASGIVKNADGGGLIGSIESGFIGYTISVQYSVYNNASKTVGQYFGDTLIQTGNSNDLDDIRGRLYHFEGIQRWTNATWVIKGINDPLPILRFQLPTSSPSPTSTSSPTISATASISATSTATRTATSSETVTSTMSSSPSPSTSTSRTTTASVTPSSSMSSSHTCSASPTATPSHSCTSMRTKTPTITSSRTETATPTTTLTPSNSQTETVVPVSPTPTATGTPTETSSSTKTPTSSSSGSASSSESATPSKTPSPSRTSPSSSSSPPTVAPSKSPHLLTIKWTILPVQRPPRYVQQHLNQRQRR